MAVATVLLCFLIFSLGGSSGMLERLQHSVKSDGSLSLLVVGDWGRRGHRKQSDVAHQWWSDAGVQDPVQRVRSPVQPLLRGPSLGRHVPDFGILGNGRLYVLDLDLAFGALSELRSFDTTDGIYDCAWSESHDSLAVAAVVDGSVKLWDAALPPPPTPSAPSTSTPARSTPPIGTPSATTPSLSPLGSGFAWRVHVGFAGFEPVQVKREQNWPSSPKTA